MGELRKGLEEITGRAKRFNYIIISKKIKYMYIIRNLFK